MKMLTDPIFWFFFIRKFLDILVQGLNLPDEGMQGFEYLYVFIDWFFFYIYRGHFENHVE